MEQSYLIELSRLVGAPVFAIRDVRYAGRSGVSIKIHGQCPILEKVGMASAIPAQQMYQDIAYFVGNTMRDAPDTRPPVEIENLEKIRKAGFDVQKSFRHRL